jgi:hypothetical protein
VNNIKSTVISHLKELLNILIVYNNYSICNHDFAYNESLPVQLLC